MRRKEKEITDKSLIDRIIRDAMVCRIALCDNGMPYIVPMNFGYKDNCLYLHCARKGRKLEILEKNNNICFEVDTHHQLMGTDKPCNWSMKYYSVIGFGRAFLIDDYQGKRDALDVIVQKYGGKGGFEYPESTLNKLTVIKIEIDSLTGKKSGY